MTQTASVAVIGGSGVYELPILNNVEPLSCGTPYGVVDSIQRGRCGEHAVVFLPRHGVAHRLPPHKINYRANIWALAELGVKRIIALNAVGGIAEDCVPGTLVVPDQLVDYTYGRDHSFADQLNDSINHVDFTEPFAKWLRDKLGQVLAELNLPWLGHGTYGCTQGPRLESAAEIRRLQRDGCTLVGMTAMPEAALARELQLDYVCLSTVVNWAAGISAQPITMAEIHAVLDTAMGQLLHVLQALLPQVASHR